LKILEIIYCIKTFCVIIVRKNKVQSVQKLEVKLEVVVENHGNKKGSGRARAGSNRSPLWKGGGVIFGPKPNQTFLKLNKKERRLALQTLLYNKKKNIVVVENLENKISEPKTKQFLKICQDCKVSLDQKILVIVSKKTTPLKLSIQNLKNVELICASNLNTLSLLKAKQILLTTLAINDIKEIYCD